ncbi:toll/interleukin-1 receptor domain-containing protein [Microbacterium sp. PAMC22086]|uniref:toll/interleukin-1 receptor domain-containing protein n=1 Tax=Microbacterium sp. PAMC22086 TaxID=2861281 RepID=UPI001C62632C|nr:toll/interleukin-1 receptor domain-containing protein [Microbacterium sp. PAMC22086]QYG12350.1 toll/interleukin-1 receptor domain-containing protein [Microbacterium sp. PAMC22086]
MTSNDGFWSYVHDDNTASFDKIVELGRDLQRVYQMISGTSVSLFIDRDALEWGDAWKSVIKSNLGTVAFFIPVITPAFFQSPVCRSEFEAFAQRTDAEGLRGLLLPILWISVEGLEDEATEDKLIRTIQDRQWEDWRDLRHEPRGSELYSRTLEKMAQRIKKANEDADSADASQVAAAVVTDAEDEVNDSEGRLEILARMEEDLNSWVPLLEQVQVGLQDMGDVAVQSTAEIAADPRGRTFAGRLLMIRETAKKLQTPADRIESAGAEFERKVSSVDQGVRIIIESAPSEIADDPESREHFESFFDMIRALGATTDTVDTQLSGFIDSIAPLQKQSRDLKKPVQAATNGVTHIRTTLGQIDAWIDLIDSTELPPDQD